MVDLHERDDLKDALTFRTVRYMLMKYDFKIESQRPEGTFVGMTRIPPLKKNIWIRRRE